MRLRGYLLKNQEKVNSQQFIDSMKKITGNNIFFHYYFKLEGEFVGLYISKI